MCPQKTFFPLYTIKGGVFRYRGVMNREERVKYWLELVDYDLDTAETLYNGGRWLYVAFMCHQVIEKILKAYWTATQDIEPPYTHNLERLANNCGLSEQMNDEQLHFIDVMVPMNIEARYPAYKEAISRRLTNDYCRSMIDKTKELQLWIRNKL